MVGLRFSEIVYDLPSPVRIAIQARYSGNEPDIVEALGREKDFTSPEAALLAGIYFTGSPPFFTPAGGLGGDEVVIGRGLHATIWACNGAGCTFHVGLDSGVFDVGSAPGFWINSRNRPGPAGGPGEGVGLNVIPGGYVQPADLCGAEYPHNKLIAWCLGANLALSGAKVASGYRVQSVMIDPDNPGLYKIYTGIAAFRAKRVIDATGLGQERRLCPTDSEVVLSFTQFMERISRRKFPLRGMKKVAVIGAGDSGKCVIEALCGQGPTQGMSVASLDFPQDIDWYGCRFETTDEWCEANRGRYARIGRLLGNEGDDYFRIDAKPKARNVSRFGDSVIVDGVLYDHAIVCVGYEPSPIEYPEGYLWQDFTVGGVVVGKQLGYLDDKLEIYRVGPAANIPLSNDERVLPFYSRIPENSASWFRYGPRTAAMARALS